MGHLCVLSLTLLRTSPQVPLIFYGPTGQDVSKGVIIKDNNVVQSILKAINTQQPFQVNNTSIGGG